MEKPYLKLVLVEGYFWVFTRVPGGFDAHPLLHCFPSCDWFIATLHSYHIATPAMNCKRRSLGWRKIPQSEDCVFFCSKYTKLDGTFSPLPVALAPAKRRDQSLNPLKDDLDLQRKMLGTPSQVFLEVLEFPFVFHTSSVR